jgi:(2Fe-2S) ferredoxin
MASVARRWQAAHPDSALAIVLGESLVEEPALALALMEAAHAAEAATDVRSAPPEGWEHDPASWSVLPQHQLHLLTCRGPRCTALDAGACWNQLRASLAEHGLREDNARTLVAATGCLYPCSCGPVLVVYPAGVWYGRLTPAAIRRIVAEHLVGGQIVEEYRLTPGVPCAGQHSS